MQGTYTQCEEAIGPSYTKPPPHIPDDLVFFRSPSSISCVLPGHPLIRAGTPTYSVIWIMNSEIIEMSIVGMSFNGIQRYTNCPTVFYALKKL